jgi:hypothetical protein
MDALGEMVQFGSLESLFVNATFLRTAAKYPLQIPCQIMLKAMQALACGFALSYRCALKIVCAATVTRGK